MGESVKRGVFRGSRPHVWLGSLNTNAAMPIIFPRFGSGSLPTFRHFFAVFRSRAACCLSGRVQTPSSSRASMSCRHSAVLRALHPARTPTGHCARQWSWEGPPRNSATNALKNALQAQVSESALSALLFRSCRHFGLAPRAITPTLAGMTIDGMSEIFFLLVSGLVVHPGCNAW